jgi:hypothetical protein
LFLQVATKHTWLMNLHRISTLRRLPRAFCLIFYLLASLHCFGEPTPKAASAFNSYVSAVESRLGLQHLSRSAFLAPVSSSLQRDLRLREGEVIIEQLTPSPNTELSGALLHHWRGTAFVPGAKAADLETLLKDFNDYPQHFSPQVLQAKVLTQQDDRLRAWMRVRQKHVLTVVLDITYDVAFFRLDERDGYSASRSTKIQEIDAPGTERERALNAQDEHGFLWRLNNYWTYQERDGGLYIQIESDSLSRSIPAGLGWAIRPFVESIPRESLEFTLHSACNAKSSK